MEVKEFKDRQAAFPGRKKLTIVKQEANILTVDEEWADNPSEEGTHVNASILTGFQQGIVEANNISNQAEGIAENARSIAQSAVQNSTTAITNADNAKIYADDAKKIADDAKVYANDAKRIASAAEQTAGSAKDIAELALNKVESFNGDVDSELSTTSIQPVQNRVITAAINSERTSRTNAVNTLQTAINTEKTNRTNADSAMQTSINNLQTKTNSLESAVNTKLTGDLYTRTVGANIDTKGLYKGLNFYIYNKNNSSATQHSVIFNPDEFSMEQTDYDSTTESKEWTINSKALAYDMVIRTQADFERWYKEIDGGDYSKHKVLFVGNGGDLEFVRDDGKYIKIYNFFILDGVNNAKIRVKNLNNSSTIPPIRLPAIYCVSSTTEPSPSGLINNLTVICEGGGFLGCFLNCRKLTNCHAILSPKSLTESYDNYSGFTNCYNLINCQVSYENSFTNTYPKTTGYESCKYLVNCKAKLIQSNYDFYNCSYLVNCSSEERTKMGAFHTCSYLQNCSFNHEKLGLGFKDCTDTPVFIDYNDYNKGYYIKHSNGTLEIHFYVIQSKATTVSYTFPCPFKTGTVPNCHRHVVYAGTSSAGQIRALNFNVVSNTGITIYSPDIASYGDHTMISAYGMWK